MNQKPNRKLLEAGEAPGPGKQESKGLSVPPYMKPVVEAAELVADRLNMSFSTWVMNLIIEELGLWDGEPSNQRKLKKLKQQFLASVRLKLKHERLKRHIPKARARKAHKP